VYPVKNFGGFMKDFGPIFGTWLPLIAGLVMVVSLWQIFEKAGKPNVASIIPFYNSFVLFEIIDWSGWWLLALFIPVVNILVLSYASYELGQRFDQSTSFSIGLVLLPFIFYPILAFSSVQYFRPSYKT
jgi:Family of unknown function (DUF5684)